MKKNIKQPVFLLFLLLLLINKSTFSQTQDSSTSNEEKNHLIVGVTYNSYMNYYGRVDSLKTQGIYPSLQFGLKNGLYLNSTFVFTNNSAQSEYAATLIEAGYNYKSSDGNWAGTLSGSKYFYNSNTYLVESAIKGIVALSASNLNQVVNITVGVDSKFSSDVDWGLHGGLDHTFRFENVAGDGVIVLDPSAYIYTGTQNFTKTYYEQKKILFIPVSQQQVTTASKKFNVLAYEFSAPIVYAVGKFNLILNPAYILPQNIVTVPDQPQMSERGSDLFYLTITAQFTF